MRYLDYLARTGGKHSQLDRLVTHCPDFTRLQSWKASPPHCLTSERHCCRVLPWHRRPPAASGVATVVASGRRGQPSRRPAPPPARPAPASSGPESVGT
ncbi:Protein of unknown function [Gryllus bimaculatus]|nr:Protein of unknown function [Gryllus bimaculatus]